MFFGTHNRRGGVDFAQLIHLAVIQNFGIAVARHVASKKNGVVVMVNT